MTDNPLVITDKGRIVSGGNFHAEPVAFAADQIALAISEIGAIAQRRVALMSENKHLANPCSTDSTPTSANQEDHVSMAAHGARRLKKMNENLNVIIGVELMCAVQGIEFRAPLKTSDKLINAMSLIRAHVPKLEEDRYMADDITAAASIISSGQLIEALDIHGYAIGDTA